jgi:hypothetical protein
LDETRRAIELCEQVLTIYDAIESPYTEVGRKELKEWDVEQKIMGTVQ